MLQILCPKLACLLYHKYHAGLVIDGLISMFLTPFEASQGFNASQSSSQKLCGTALCLRMDSSAHLDFGNEHGPVGSQVLELCL